MSPQEYDRELERRMDSAALRMVFSPDGEDRRRAMEELRELKKLQRPERVAQLEQEKGLA